MFTPLELFYRVIIVIESCETREQLRCARRYAEFAKTAIIRMLEDMGETDMYIDLFLIDVSHDFNAAIRRTIKAIR